MVVKNKINSPVGEVKVEDGIIKLSLDGTGFMPNKMFFKDKLFYGVHGGINLLVRDGKSMCVFIYNLHLYLDSIFVTSEEGKLVTECMKKLCVNIVNDKKNGTHKRPY